MAKYNKDLELYQKLKQVDHLIKYYVAEKIKEGYNYLFVKDDKITNNILESVYKKELTDINDKINIENNKENILVLKLIEIFYLGFLHICEKCDDLNIPLHLRGIISKIKKVTSSCKIEK